MSKYEFLLKHGHYAEEIAELVGERHMVLLQDLLYLGYTQGKLDSTEEKLNELTREQAA